MKKAITVLSYCDTTEKKEILKSLISRLKILYPEHAVLVYSHYSGVEFEYYQQADYYIYDRSNPTSPRMFFHWTYIPQLDTKFHRKFEDFGLAVVQMIKRSALFLDSIGVESSLYLNYDMDIEKKESIEMISISEEPLFEHFGIFTKWGNQEFSLCYFWLDIKRIGRPFFDSIDRDKYLSYDTSFIAEKIFHEIMTEGLGDRCLNLDLPLDGKIVGTTRDIEKGTDLSRYFSTMVASISNTDQTRSLAIWNSRVNIENILVEVDGTQIELHNSLDNKMFFLENLPQYEIREIRILKVNSEEIEPYSMSLDRTYWERNTHHKIEPYSMSLDRTYWERNTHHKV